MESLTAGLIEVNSNFDREIIVIDATRCQNGEELATIIGQAINENPGKGALKALGGTFMPSMGNAMRQDRYGWIDMNFTGVYTNDTANSSKSFAEAVIGGSNSQTTLEQIPASGWLRTDEGGRRFPTTSEPNHTCPAFAPYHSREVYNNSGTWTVRS